MTVSDCCGAEAGEFYDYGICPDCREHCEWVDTEEDENRDLTKRNNKVED